MDNKHTYSKLNKSISALVIILAIIAATLLGSIYTPLISYADSSSYTDVLTDLQSDSSFNVSDYPAVSSDYSLSIIQIGESEDNELFIYVYQPYTGSTYDLAATSINISTTVGEDNLYYKNYSLSLLSKSGTLCKYLVNNFTVNTATVRYYDISSIYRTYYTAIDGSETGGNTTSELAIAVAQQWAVGEINGVTYYDMQETNVVTVSSYAGHIRYWTGDKFVFIDITSSYYDSYFIAFDCDYDIDELYEADISFYTVPVTHHYEKYVGEDDPFIDTYTYGDIDSTYYDTPLTIDSGDAVSYESTGYFGIFGQTTYSWDRICTVSDFISNLDSSECDYDTDFINNISGKQWVIRFYETEFTKTTIGTTSTVVEDAYYLTYTEVTDITILRLKFLSEGTVYNLGVVSNKITGSSTPSGTVGRDTDGWYDKLKTIVAIIMIVLLLIICAPVLPYIAKFIVWVISLPFKLISEIINLFKKKK